MPRKLIALFVASTLGLGSISTSAWSAPGPTQQVKASGATTARSEAKNVPPLAAAGAAGIREAQGAGNELYILGGFVGVFVLLTLLDTDNDDNVPVPTTTGTN